MSHCERFETHLSAFLDDELERPGQLELLDHVVRCADCRAFTVQARALDGMLAVVRPSRDAAPPAPEVWPRIRKAAVPRPARTSAWSAGLRAAAVVILSVGLGVLFLTGAPSPTAVNDREVDVQLGADAAGMDDARFLALTAEVLRADPRYHSALHRVMEQVVRDARFHEAALEYPEADDPEEATRLDSDPSNPV